MYDKTINKKLLLAGIVVLAIALGSGAALNSVMADPHDEKTLIDHKGKLICVDSASVPAHLAHGDTIEDVC